MRTILVVDDSPTMRRMIAACLYALGPVRTIEASNGLEALECLATERIDLVILDLNMPLMHGLDFLRLARRRPSSKHLPIIVLTTRQDGDCREEALSAGATGYLTKPFSPAALGEVVAEFLRHPKHRQDGSTNGGPND